MTHGEMLNGELECSTVGTLSSNFLSDHPDSSTDGGRTKAIFRLHELSTRIPPKQHRGEEYEAVVHTGAIESARASSTQVRWNGLGCSMECARWGSDPRPVR